MISTYEWKRNQLIKQATLFADKSVNDNRNMREGENRTARWNRLYHGKMNELVKKEGI